MFIGYNGTTIYYIYLHKKTKVICIKDLKIFENVNEKQNSWVYLYNAIIASKKKTKDNKLQYFLFLNSQTFPALISFQNIKTLILKNFQTTMVKIKSGQIF